MKKNFLFLTVCSLFGASTLGATASKSGQPQLNIAFVDSFRAMRECADGQEIGKEIDNVRNKASKEFQEEADKLAKEETDLNQKSNMLKQAERDKKKRELDKKKRDLEERLQEKEQELKAVMQEKTETLARQIEDGIVEVAKAKNLDVVLDTQTGRAMYTKDNNEGDLTKEAIAAVDKKSSATKVAHAQNTSSASDQKTNVAQSTAKSDAKKGAAAA